MELLSSGRRFMIDVMVNSLIAHNSLRPALEAAIACESAHQKSVRERQQKNSEKEPGGETGSADGESEETDDTKSDDEGEAIPLLQLVQQILRNLAVETCVQLQSGKVPLNNLPASIEGKAQDLPVRSPSMELLVQFQRLLFTKWMNFNKEGGLTSGRCQKIASLHVCHFYP